MYVDRFKPTKYEHIRCSICVEEEEIGDKLKEIWEMYGDNAESMQLTVVGLLRPRILVDIVEIED